MMEEEKINFQNFLLKYQKNNGDKLLPNTIDRYTYYLKSYDLSNLDGQELIDKIQDVINQRPAQVLFSTFRMYLQFRGYDKHHELYKKLIPPRKRANSSNSFRFLQARVLSKAEIDRLIDESDLFGKMVINLLFETGMRRAELMSIKLKDIIVLKEPHGIIHAKINVMGKGSRARACYIRKGTLECIKQYHPEKIPEKKLVEFYGKDGTPLKCQEEALYYYIKKKFRDVLGRDISSGSHVFRASISTYLLDSGATLKEVATFLGHSSTATTEKSYAKISSRQGMNAFLKFEEGLE